MQAVAENIENTYGKDVYIAETSYCYTTEDGDGFANSFAGTEDLVDGYVATVQSQATMIHDICAAADEAGALGVFYWEGTWIPVGDADADNTALWENTEAAGRAAIRRTMIRMMPVCITEAVPGTIRRCLILRDIRLPH